MRRSKPSNRSSRKTGSRTTSSLCPSSPISQENACAAASSPGRPGTRATITWLRRCMPGSSSSTTPREHSPAPSIIVSGTPANFTTLPSGGRSPGGAPPTSWPTSRRACGRSRRGGSTWPACQRVFPGRRRTSRASWWPTNSWCRGLSVRNRQPGLGAPLVAVLRRGPDDPLQRSVPATVLLRVEGGLAGMAAGRLRGTLEARLRELDPDGGNRAQFPHLPGQAGHHRGDAAHPPRAPGGTPARDTHPGRRSTLMP